MEVDVNVAQVETLREYEIRQQVAEREKDMSKAADAFEAAMWIERNLGLRPGGISAKDLPKEWSVTRREHLVWRAGMFSQIPEDTFRKWLREARREEHLRPGFIRNKADRFITDKKRAERLLEPLGISGMDLYVEDIYKVQALHLGNATAVITDPPYEEKTLPLWGELVRFSGRVLNERGWLVAMSGQRYLPQVLASMETAARNAGMRYVHTLAVHTPGAQSAQVWVSERNPLNSDWKPVIVYSKGEPANWPDGFRDFILSEGNDKEHHKWGQPINVFHTLIDKFTQKKDLVVDPFLGGGTTAAAAYRLDRAMEGFDISEECVIESRTRLFKENVKDGSILVPVTDTPK
jgi:hypothetical protein